MYAEMLESGRRNGKGGLSVRTVRYTHTVIRKALSDAVGWNLLTRNVADAAQPPKKQKTTNATWSADQLRTFLSHVQEDRLFATWQLAAMTGMRRGEILGLSWADIDFDNARLSVRRSLVSSDYKIKVSEPKTERGRRTVALDPAMLRVLRDHQGRQLLERVAMAGDWGNELDLVFTREDGSPIHPQAFSEMFEKHVKDSKLPKLSLHGLRHTHATIALRAGVHPKVVSERLGHASVAFTLRRLHGLATGHAGNSRQSDRGARSRHIGLQSVSKAGDRVRAHEQRNPRPAGVSRSCGARTRTLTT